MFSQWKRQQNVDKRQSTRAGFFSECLGHDEGGLIPAFNLQNFLQAFFHHLVRLLIGGGNGLVNQCIVGRSSCQADLPTALRAQQWEHFVDAGCQHRQRVVRG
jgi:hypothetical protein